MTDYPALVAALRAGAADRAPHDRVAVELLIAHGVWLRRPPFRAIAVIWPAGQRAWIAWTAALAAWERGQFRTALPAEVAVLDLALALGTDRYRLAKLDVHGRGLVAEAFRRSLGLDTTWAMSGGADDGAGR